MNAAASPLAAVLAGSRLPALVSTVTGFLARSFARCLAASHVRGLAVLMLPLVILTGCAGMPEKQAPDLPTSSDQTEQQRRAQIRLQLAVGYFQQGQMSTALDEVKQALAIEPNLADAYIMRALIYMELLENRLAEENFVQALKLAPNNADLANNYGWFLCQNGRAEQSIAYFEKALANRSYASPSKALNNAGLCSMRLNRMDVAEKYLSRAFQLDPASPDVNLSIAKMYLTRRDQERSQFYVRRVLATDQVNPDVLWTAIKIERLAGDKMAEAGLVTQLRRRFPNSPEYAAYLRGAFNE